MKVYTVGAGWAPFTLVREMFLARSSTLDFASTMEDVPAVVDLKRTKGTFFDAAERCIIFLGGRRKREEREKTESGRLIEMGGRETRCTAEVVQSASQKKADRGNSFS